MIVRTKFASRGFLPRLAILAVLALSCGDDEGDCSDEIETAEEFTRDPANLQCQADEDCVVVGTGCHTVSRGFCGQAQLNRDVAESEAWVGVISALGSCEEGSCVQCNGGLVAGCAEGLCGGPL